MSFNVDTIAPVTYAPGAGAKPASMPIKLCTPLDAQVGPSTMRLDIPWTEAPYNASFSNRNVAVRVDLRAMSVAGGGAPLDAIRFCKIDNTFNDVSVYVRFGDTGDVIQCPPNSIVGVEVQTSNQNMTLYGLGFFDGRSPVTSYFFSNAPQQPFFIPDAGRYRVFGALVDTQGSTANQATYNFANCKFGNPFPGRVMAAVVGADCAGAVPVASISIGGLAVPIGNLVTASAGNPLGLELGIGTVAVPTGLTGTTSITFSGAVNNCFLALYSLEGTSDDTPFDTDSDLSFFTDATVAVDVIPGSFSLFASIDSTSSPVIYGDGIVIDADIVLETFSFTSAHEQSDEALINTCTFVDRRLGIAASYI